MKTVYFRDPTKENIEAAAKIIRDGGLLAIPTETVYGLGADALNEDAVLRIFLAKGRPQDNPLIIHVPDSSWKMYYLCKMNSAMHTEKFENSIAWISCFDNHTDAKEYHVMLQITNPHLDFQEQLIEIINTYTAIRKQLNATSV